MSLDYIASAQSGRLDAYISPLPLSYPQNEGNHLFSLAMRSVSLRHHGGLSAPHVALNLFVDSLLFGHYPLHEW